VTCVIPRARLKSDEPIEEGSLGARALKAIFMTADYVMRFLVAPPYASSDEQKRGSLIPMASEL
jgi:hypothetical protein